MIPITIDNNGQLAISRCTCDGNAASTEHRNQPALPTPAILTDESGRQVGSYEQILKSSALIGGSTVLKIAIGIIRTKAMAILLGPAGFGLFGLYGSISDLGLSVAGMGVNSSGVRQIAEAAGTGDTARIAHTAAVLRRTSITLGVVGALLLTAISRQVSFFTFRTTQYWVAISLLSLVLLFRLISDGQAALIQGTRRIADLAKVAVVGALLGTLLSIPLVYFYRERGVVPALVSVAASSLLASWWYSRKIPLKKYLATPSEVVQEAGALLKLGSVFMASGLMVMGGAYWIRILLLRTAGVEATGFYQAAWTLGGLYVGVILQAMGADFYPRLTANANDNAACNRLVNEQACVGMLLAGPGVIATLTFAPFIIAMLYSAKFGGAVEILRWISLGAALQVVTWPMGFIIIAKGQKQLFFWSELAWTIVYLTFAWFCVNRFGLKGAGIAFFGSYIFHGLIIYPIVRRLSGFRWSSENKMRALLFFSLIAGVLCSFYLLPPIAAFMAGFLALLISVYHSLLTLLRLVSQGSLDRIPRPIRRLLLSFGVIPANAINVDV